MLLRGAKKNSALSVGAPPGSIPSDRKQYFCRKQRGLDHKQKMEALKIDVLLVKPSQVIFLLSPISWIGHYPVICIVASPCLDVMEGESK